VQREPIGVIGAGWVGLVTAACFAELGHAVTVRDVVPERIADLDGGRVPIYEPGLEELLARNSERLRFTLEIEDVFREARLAFVCVGTPSTYSGDADLSAVWRVLDELPEFQERAVLVMKSTVPVGTGEKVREELDSRGLAHVGYVSNPEFLAEGTAVQNFIQPDRVVIGAFTTDDADAVAALYEPLGAPIVRTDIASAEMIKLASNAFLATRISFINEIANVCEVTGADVVDVARGMGLDHRLGPHFLRAGLGYGGSCLVGDETVLVRFRDSVRLMTLENLFKATQGGDVMEILSWQRDGEGPEFRRIDLLTRRHYAGEVTELRTKMGRRVTCTLDHVVVTREGRKLAADVTTNDWLPLAQGTAHTARRHPRRLNVIRAFEADGLGASDVIVRPYEGELAAIGGRDVREAIAVLAHPRGATARSHDIVRSGALRLDEAARLDLDIEEATFATAKNGTYVPATIDADEAFWRVVGLYIAEGHCAAELGSGRRRLQWSFHPEHENELVEEVARYWEGLGVKASVSHRRTSKVVTVSSRILASWWLNELGLGRNCYTQRLPDLIWDEPTEHKRALLAGLWLGDGSWSYVDGGPSVVLEYGTVSRELADGILRLLGELGIVARLKVGRTAKSTVDTYWLVVAGANQVERLLDLVPEDGARLIRDSIGRQAKRIAPTGYRRDANAAWVRVVDVRRRPYSGYVYSLEVSPTHTFVTTGGLVVSNCFPKDVQALKQLAGNSGYHFQLLNAVIEVNELQKRRVIAKLEKHLGALRGRTVALLGLAFKPNTNDLREASSLVLASRLLAEGARVRAWDPVALEEARAQLRGVELVESLDEAVKDADAAVIVTEWDELRGLASTERRDAMRTPLIVDGRNMLDSDAVRAAGFLYEGVGRPASPLHAVPETSEREPGLHA
jgi:UDPglucose 6-dehydrogenase